jgi:hypothetical protein
MSIIIQVSKSENEQESEIKENVSINYPKNSNSNPNDLSYISGNSSKYTLSGDDMISNSSSKSKKSDAEIIIKTGKNESNLSNISNLITEKKYDIKEVINPREESGNFVYNIIKLQDEDKKPKIFNKAFITDDAISIERINRVNEKVNSMKKISDKQFSKTNESSGNSSSSSVKLTCFHNICRK